jgi:hypothetical protein
MYKRGAKVAKVGLELEGKQDSQIWMRDPRMGE